MSFGTVTFDDPVTAPIGTNRSGDPLVVEKSVGRWTPPAELKELHDHGVFLPLERWRAADGFRRYWPGMGSEELLQYVPQIGLAIIRKIRDLSPEEASYYKGCFMIFRYVRGISYLNERGVQAHLTRNLDWSRDLFVRVPGRATDSQRTVLPADVGTPSSDDKPWNIAKLCQIGRQAALDAGIRSPISKVSIPYGLLAAAQLNPLRLNSTEEIEHVVRSCLFESEAFLEPIDDETREMVTQRLADAMNKHKLDTLEEFNRWMFDSHSSLIKQLAKQKKPKGGELPRDLVRRVLLHLGWESYRAVGECLNVYMRWVRNSLPDELTEDEQELFDLLYLRQPFLANLPLALIVERLHFLKPALLRLWNTGFSEEKVRVLHRMMYYYAELASNRREADRRSKKNKSPMGDSSVGEIESETPLEVALNPYLAAANQPDIDPFREAVEHLMELHGVRCEPGCANWDYEIVSQDDNSYKIDIYCECPEPNSFEVSKEEFEKERQRLDL